LQLGRHVPYFIQEESTAVCHFEAAEFLHYRSGESALFMPEEFAFEKACRDCRAVELDERAAAAPAMHVDRLGDEFFPGAGLSFDQNG
jgi:hypothetical protein